MGEYADELIDNEIGEPGSFGYWRKRSTPPPPKCNRCGAGGLWWVDTGVRWRLMEGDKPHVCKPSDDGFGPVTP